MHPKLELYIQHDDLLLKIHTELEAIMTLAKISALAIHHEPQSLELTSFEQIFNNMELHFKSRKPRLKFVKNKAIIREIHNIP